MTSAPLPSPLDNRHGEHQSDPEQQRLRRWKQGCQAIFAGFVAAAHLQNLTPTIRDFWSTPQKDMVLPTLRSLAPAYGHAHDVVKGKLEGHQAQVRSGDHDQGDENGPGRGILSEVLYAVLTDSTNQYTKLCETPHDGRSGELDGAEWKLTQKGRGLFDTRSDGQVAQVHVAVPKWWDM